MFQNFVRTDPAPLNNVVFHFKSFFIHHHSLQVRVSSIVLRVQYLPMWSRKNLQAKCNHQPSLKLHGSFLDYRSKIQNNFERAAKLCLQGLCFTHIQMQYVPNQLQETLAGQLEQFMLSGSCMKYFLCCPDIWRFYKTLSLFFSHMKEQGVLLHQGAYTTKKTLERWSRCFFHKHLWLLLLYEDHPSHLWEYTVSHGTFWMW